MSRNLGILLVGVGGQGVLTTARLLGLAALGNGLEARVGQIHGMAQRGGSLESTVVLGPGETAYLSAGEVDVLLALDPLEAARALPRITERTFALVNSTPRVPYSMTSRGQSFPPLATLLGDLERRVGQLLLIDATAVARGAGAPKALGIAMLGALAELELLPFAGESLEESLASEVRETRRSSTLATFRAGRAEARRLREAEPLRAGRRDASRPCP